MTPEEWFKQEMRKAKRSPYFWWEYFKLWIVEKWLRWRNEKSR